VCVWVPVCVTSAPGVLEGMLEGVWPRRERDVAAALRGHRARQGRGGIVVQHGVGARLGRAAARRGGGTARPHGAVAHACARVLGSEGRGVAVPCTGHRHSGPAT
jgi:hypothetical protein